MRWRSGKVGAYFDGPATERTLSSRVNLQTLVVTQVSSAERIVGHHSKNSPHMLHRQVFVSAPRSAAAPGLQAFEGASYRSRQAALCGVAAKNSVALVRARPNPSIEGTSTSGLRPLAAAPHVKR